MGGTFGNDDVVEMQCNRDASIASLRTSAVLCITKKCKKRGGWVSIIYATHPPSFLHFLSWTTVLFAMQKHNTPSSPHVLSGDLFELCI